MEKHESQPRSHVEAEKLADFSWYSMVNLKRGQKLSFVFRHEIF